MLAELAHHPELVIEDEKSVMIPKIHLAALHSALKCLTVAKEVFDFPPGLLHSCCKTLMYQNNLRDEMFAKVLTLRNCDEDNE